MATAKSATRNWLPLLSMIATVAYAESDGRQNLASFSAPPGLLATAGSCGQVVTLEPGSGRLSVWAEDGAVLYASSLPLRAGGGETVLLAAQQESFLVCARSDDDVGVSCSVFGADAGGEKARFQVDAWPVKVFPTAEGWLVETARSTDKPTFRLFGSDGREKQAPGLPADLWRRASEELHTPAAAISRIFTIGAEVWGVPAGFYELWRLTGQQPQKVPVPKCLDVVGNQLVGEPAVRKLLAIAAESDDQTRRGLEAFVARTRSDTTPMHGYTGAVVQASTCGMRAVVLLEPFPERAEGGCRLDTWAFPGPVVVESVALPGVCPSFVSLGQRGAWLKRGRRFEWLSIESSAVQAQDPCGPGGAKRSRPDGGIHGGKTPHGQNGARLGSDRSH